MKVKKFKNREAFLKALKPNVYVRVGHVLSGFPVTRGDLLKVKDVNGETINVPTNNGSGEIGLNASWFDLEIHYEEPQIPKLSELEFSLVLNEHRKIWNPVSSLEAEERKLQEKYDGLVAQTEKAFKDLEDLRNKIAETVTAQDVDISRDVSEQFKRLELLTKSKMYKGFMLEDMILTGYTGDIWNSEKEHFFDWKIKVFIKTNMYAFEDTNGVGVGFCVGNIKDTLVDMIKTRRFSQFFEMIYEFLVKQQKGEFKGM